MCVFHRLLLLVTGLLLLTHCAPRPVAAPTPPVTAAAGEFLRVEGDQIITPGGQPVFLRGINVDNFYYAAPWEPELALQYATQEQMQHLAQAGVTAIRLGFHWQFFETDLGFRLTDRYLEWCRPLGIYLVLDMHVAPPDEDISGGVIWGSPEAQQQFLDLWANIAARYQAEPLIAGYDLYNEPRPTEPEQWWILARRAVQTIRAVDPNHMLFVEDPGDMRLEKLDDPNIVYSIHDYNPFIVSHAGADWLGDVPLPTGYPYPGEVLTATVWADWSQDASVRSEPTPEWTYWESGLLTVPDGVEWATLKPFAAGPVGEVFFDDLEVLHNGNKLTVYNSGAEEESRPHPGRPANWYFYGEGDVSGGWSDQAHSGAHSLTLVGQDGFSTWSQSAWVFTAPLFRVQPGDKLQVRGWLYAPDLQPDSGCGLGVDYLRGMYEFYGQEQMQADLQPTLNWAQANQVPIYVGEFGAMRPALEDADYRLIQDKIELMNAAGLHWALWTLRDTGEPSFGLYHDEGVLDMPVWEILQQGLNPAPRGQVFMPLLRVE